MPKRESKEWRQSMKDMHKRPGYRASVREGQAASEKMGRPRRTYAGFISPEGQVFRNIDNLTAFAKDFDLDRGALARVADGKLPHHKGWTAVAAEVAEPTEDEPPGASADECTSST